MHPFLYLSIQCSPSPSHLSSWPPPLSQLLIFKFHSFTRFLIFHISPDRWWEAHLLSERSSNKWVPPAYSGTFGARLRISSSSNKKKGIIKGVKWEMGEMIHWHILINKVGVSQPEAMIVSQARSLMCNRASGLFAVFTDIPHLYLRLQVVENAADRLGLSCKKKKSALDFRFYLIYLHISTRKQSCLIFFPTLLKWFSVSIDFFLRI